MTILRPRDERLAPRVQIHPSTCSDLESEIRLASAKARRWRVAVRRIGPSWEDPDANIDVLHEWLSRGDHVERITTVGSDEVARRSRPLDLDAAIRRICSHQEGKQFEFLRLGWTVKQITKAFAPICFHPATLDQWAGCIQSERLSKLAPIEVLDGSAADAGRGLRMERFSLWLSADGTALYAIGRAVAEDPDRLVVARLDPRSVRLIPRSEVSDAAHEGST